MFSDSSSFSAARQRKGSLTPRPPPVKVKKARSGKPEGIKIQVSTQDPSTPPLLPLCRRPPMRTPQPKTALPCGDPPGKKFIDSNHYLFYHNSWYHLSRSSTGRHHHILRLALIRTPVLKAFQDQGPVASLTHGLSASACPPLTTEDRVQIRSSRRGASLFCRVNGRERSCSVVANGICGGDATAQCCQCCSRPISGSPTRVVPRRES
jgi:hypothetical protein